LLIFIQSIGNLLNLYKPLLTILLVIFGRKLPTFDAAVNECRDRVEVGGSGGGWGWGSLFAFYCSSFILLFLLVTKRTRKDDGQK
jgi:hypothetical protein